MRAASISRERVLVSTVLLLLVATSVAVVVSTGHLDQSRRQIWGILAVAVGLASAVVFPYGLARWRDLPDGSPDPREVTPPVAVMLLAALVVTQLPRIVLGAAPNWPITALIFSALVGAFPTACTMHAIRTFARHRLPEQAGSRAAALLSLRRLLKRSLPAVGSLVALTTFALGAALKTPTDPHLARLARDAPGETVIIFGSFGSLLVALFYVPAASVLRERAHQLCDELFELRELQDATSILEVAKKHRTLAELLGVQQSLLSELQAGIIILAPLITTAFSSLLQT
jgi:hypothetical protein